MRAPGPVRAPVKSGTVVTPRAAENNHMDNQILLILSTGLMAETSWADVAIRISLSASMVGAGLIVVRDCREWWRER